MTKTKLWAFGLILLCTLFTSVAQVLYKFGADKLSFDILSIITNYPLIIGLCLYGLSAVLLIIAFKGGEVSTLYPIIATSYVWVSMLSIYFLSEVMTPLKWTGVIIIFLGVSFVGIGSKDGIKYTEAI